MSTLSLCALRGAGHHTWAEAARSITAICLLALGAFTMTAQAQQPLPDPSLVMLRNTDVATIARQGDGKFLVAGGGVVEYSYQSGHTPESLVAGRFPIDTRERLVRVNADGSFDRSFTVDIDGPGRIDAIRIFGNFAYVLGDFTSIGGVARAGLARINLTTNAVDAQWNPNPVPQLANQRAVGDMVLDGQGNLYTFGSIYNIGGKSQVRLAKILASSPTGQADPNFDGRRDNVSGPDSINSNPQSIAIAAGNAQHIYVYGRLSIPQANRNTRIFRIDTTTGLPDTTWSPDLTAIDMSPAHMVVDTNGDVFLAGQSSGTATIGQNFLSARSLVRLAANGQLAPGWSGVSDPPASPNPVIAIRAHYYLALDGAGSLFAFAARFLGDTIEYSPVKYNIASGQPDARFATGIIAGGFSISPWINVQSDGVYFPGNGYYGASRTGAVFKVDATTGALQSGFSVNLKELAVVSTSTRMADGRVLFGGNINEVNGVAVNGVIRLNLDGTFDPGFVPAISGSPIAIKEIAGKLYVGGTFNFANGQPRKLLARYDLATGALDNWAPAIDGNARAFTGDASNVYMVGGFYSVDGNITRCVAKVSATTGAVDTAWQPALANMAFGSLCQRSIAKVGNYVYLGMPNNNNFSGLTRILVNGQQRTLARIDATTGQVDNSFDPNPSGPVSAMDTDGTSVYVSGNFASIAGVATRLAKFNGATGAIDTAFTQPLTGITSNPIWLRPTPAGVFLVWNEFFPNQDQRTQVWKILPNGTRDTAWAPVLEVTGFTDQFNAAIEPLGDKRIVVGAGFGQAGRGIPRFSVAAFSMQAPVGLTVNIAGEGTVGMVNDGGAAGALCSDCRGGPFVYDVDPGSSVTLTARARVGWTFVGWLGNNGAASCSGTGSCTFTMTAGTTVTASFRRNPSLLEQ